MAHRHIVHDAKTGKWLLYSADGSKLLGTHDSEQEALAQEKAIQAAKHAKGREGAIEDALRELHDQIEADAASWRENEETIEVGIASTAALQEILAAAAAGQIAVLRGSAGEALAVAVPPAMFNRMVEYCQAVSALAEKIQAAGGRATVIMGAQR